MDQSKNQRSYESDDEPKYIERNFYISHQLYIYSTELDVIQKQ